MTNADLNKKFISSVPLFDGLKDRQLQLIASRMVERNYAPGETIVEQGQGGEGFFLITAGKAQATRTRADGEKVAVNTFGPADFFGELALLEEGGVRTATITATEPVSCLVLARWDFLAALRQDADMAVVILQEIARRFRIALDLL
ncbi:MAG: cyclic nucleotide-binding domain-containing protein [Anaerolineales bacterium]